MFLNGALASSLLMSSERKITQKKKTTLMKRTRNSRGTKPRLMNVAGTNTSQF